LVTLQARRSRCAQREEVARQWRFIRQRAEAAWSARTANVQWVSRVQIQPSVWRSIPRESVVTSGSLVRMTGEAHEASDHRFRNQGCVTCWWSAGGLKGLPLASKVSGRSVGGAPGWRAPAAWQSGLMCCVLGAFVNRCIITFVCLVRVHCAFGLLCV
jgi:hypothetical protein